MGAEAEVHGQLHEAKCARLGVHTALCSDIDPCCIYALWMLVKKTLQEATGHRKRHARLSKAYLGQYHCNPL